VFLLDELREAWHAESRGHRIALVIILIVAVDLRLLYIAQPMRYDESVTWVYFARYPWHDALSLYTYPNNHLFHTALVKAFATMLGPSPWVLRLPAFLAGVLAVPATYVMTRALYGARAALLATALVASSGILVLYSTNARGYSLIVLAFLLLAIIGRRLIDGAPTSQWLSFAVVAALGLWTVPVMLYPLGAVCGWIALSLLTSGRARELRFMFIALAITALLTMLAYSPVVAREGIASITRNKFVTPTGWMQFFREMRETSWDALASWSLGVPPALSVPIAACAVAALVKHSVVSRSKVGLPLAVFVWCAWLLVVKHRAPFARVWIWLVPLVAALAGAGLVAALESSSRIRRYTETRLPAIAVGLSLLWAMSVGMSYAVLLDRDTGTYREAEDAAVALKPILRPGDRVLAFMPTNGPLAYYFDRLGIPQTYLALDESKAKRLFLIADRAEGQSLQALAAHTMAGDSARFLPPMIVSEFPASTIALIIPRNAPAR